MALHYACQLEPPTSHHLLVEEFPEPYSWSLCAAVQTLELLSTMKSVYVFPISSYGVRDAMDQQAEDRSEITDSNLFPVIQVMTWVLLAAIFLAVIFRFVARLFLTRQYHYDDLFIVLAFVCLSDYCSSKAKVYKPLRYLL